METTCTSQRQVRVRNWNQKGILLRKSQNRQEEYGCVILLTSQGNDSSEHSRWITSLNKRHFEYLSTLDDIETIVGLLPGTAEFAAELQSTLNSKLVLFATQCTLVGQECIGILLKSNEVWCLGPKAHIHYKRLCQGISSDCGQRCKEILLKPHVKNSYYWQGIPSRKIVSTYNTENKSVNVVDYKALCSALRQLSVNAKKAQKTEPEWLVHGLNDQKQIVRSIQRYGKQDELKFTALCEISSLDETKTFLPLLSLTQKMIASTSLPSVQCGLVYQQLSPVNLLLGTLFSVCPVQVKISQ